MRSVGTPGGNRLRVLRENAGRTQLDVELDANLGSGYLQRVESGKVQHPERDTLERITAALGARYTERRDILELFGYIVDAPLPGDDEIQWAINACQSELDSAVFPAYLLDCAHRLLAWNRFVPALFNLDATALRRVSMLRLIFDPAYRFAPLIANPDEFYAAQIRALRYEMYPFRSEAWYGRLIEEMLRFPLFQRYWKASESAQTHPVAARPLTPLELRLPGTDWLQFRLLSETFAQDRRFRVIYDVPAEPHSMQWCLGRL
jgi:transcriptional regulator with XRE-family HTH domain